MTVPEPSESFYFLAWCWSLPRKEQPIAPIDQSKRNIRQRQDEERSDGVLPLCGWSN